MQLKYGGQNQILTKVKSLGYALRPIWVSDFCRFNSWTFTTFWQKKCICRNRIYIYIYMCAWIHLLLLARCWYACKILQELPGHQRSDAVSSMVYEANARMRDPVYGCVGAISSLQQQVDVLQNQLALAQAEVVHMRMRQLPAVSPSSCEAAPQSRVNNTQHLSSYYSMDTEDLLWS